MADALTRGIVINILKAQKSHALHHQNALALKRLFHITREQARQIVKNCGDCPQVYHPLKMGVNPRGLKALSQWQMDVTHVPEFGKLAYVHVTVDTYSHMIFASARTGEAVKDIIQHLIQCFTTMGCPKRIKTNNAPAYTSKALAIFLQNWDIEHVTGISYNPRGQEIIKKTHQILKNQIIRLKQAHTYFSPGHLLSHSFFVLNHLNTDEQGNTPAMKHWSGLKNEQLPQVYWKDLLSGSWKGPDALISSGRGYACVFPQDADSPIWIPD